MKAKMTFFLSLFLVLALLLLILSGCKSSSTSISEKVTGDKTTSSTADEKVSDAAGDKTPATDKDTQDKTDASIESFPMPPSTVRIVFAAHSHKPSSGEEIFVMNTDGTGITNISNSPEDERHPSWSPDGTKIAFTSERDGHAQVYVMNSDGSGQTRITDSENKEFFPRWSPDGTKIIFSRGIDLRNDLFAINADGSGLMRLTETADISENYPDWSPDGKWIIFSAFGTGTKGGIYIMDTENWESRLLIAGPLHYPRWSPDGKWIVYDGQSSGVFELFLYNFETKESKKLTNHPKGPGGYNKCPSFSPDGKQVVFFSTDRQSQGLSGKNIFKINVDGTQEIALTDDSNEENKGGFYPDWSPVP